MTDEQLAEWEQARTPKALSAFAAMVRHVCDEQGDAAAADRAHDFLSGAAIDAKNEIDALMRRHAALVAEVRRLRESRRDDLMRVAEAAFRAGYDDCTACWAPEDGECPECGVGQDRGAWDETYRATPWRVAEIAAIVDRVTRKAER